MFRLNLWSLLLLLQWVGPSMALEGFARDCTIGLAVAGSVTIVFTLIVCLLAHFAPAMCCDCCFRREKSEEYWVHRNDLEYNQYHQYNQSSVALHKSYA